ncbi:MAG TPA: nitrogenase component 1 [Desulfobacteria bacterium]|nr:nitrogenase component 1 [Desulfobacteria bacterium]
MEVRGKGETITERHSVRSVTENPCHMCMPMGGILPFKGLEKSMVLIHGSQGCSTYMRRAIAEHFNEPIDVGSTSLNEKGTIYGGEKNLKQGLDNLRQVYRPKLIGVLTTCLAETIGEDIDRISADYLEERRLKQFPIVTVSTPGYGDSNFEGYWLATTRIVAKLAQDTKQHEKVNIIVPNISPADIRELKRLLQLMKIKYTLLPDFSDTLDRPFTRPYTKIPAGGTRLKDIAAMPGAPATIQFGNTVEERFSPGKYLEEQYGVPVYNLPLPIGVDGTDRFLAVLKEISGKAVPKSIQLERGRLLDCMIDAHKYNSEGQSVIFGEPELVYAVTKTCLENGIYPRVIATGSKNSRLKELLEPELKQVPYPVQLLNQSDFAAILAHSETANLAIGPSEGKFLTEKRGIPLVRIGFPINDRVGGQRILSVGYTGTATLLDRLTNTLLENKLKNYRRSMYKQYYRGERKWHAELAD